MYDPTFYNEWIDLLSGNDLFHAENSACDVSPLLTSSMTTPSMTTPSLVFDGPQDLNDSPLFNAPFTASPSLEPALGFFPDLTDAETRPYIQVAIAPSVTIPVDDTSPITTIPGSLSPALNIPWSTDVSNSSTDILQNVSSASPSILSSFTSFTSDSSNSSSTVVSTTSSPSMNLPVKSTTRNKRSIRAVDKDPQIVADELAVKRAKNTKAARRSRLRKLMKMNSLEQQVTDLKTENNDLQTRIAVLESQNKGLEEKNSEKDARVKMLEQQLTEAHERLINRT
jgi:hypothetical protein